MDPICPRFPRARHSVTTVLSILVAAGTLLIAGAVAAQGTGAPTDGRGDAEEMDLEAIARALDNPLGNLWLLFMENDLMRFRGDPAPNSKWVNSFMLQPILPIPLTENWNLVTRPIIPLVSAPELSLSPPVFGDCPGNCNTPPRNNVVIPPSVMALLDAGGLPQFNESDLEDLDLEDLGLG